MSREDGYLDWNIEKGTIPTGDKILRGGWTNCMEVVLELSLEFVPLV